MSFLRHREIYQVEESWRGRNHGPARARRLDESPVGYSLAGCSPAEPASASPTGGTLQQWRGALQLAFRCYHTTTLTRGLTLGAHPSLYLSESFVKRRTLSTKMTTAGNGQDKRLFVLFPIDIKRRHSRRTNGFVRALNRLALALVCLLWWFSQEVVLDEDSRK